jgi:hypothetical protein
MRKTNRRSATAGSIIDETFRTAVRPEARHLTPEMWHFVALGSQRAGAAGRMTAIPTSSPRHADDLQEP